MSDEPGIGRIYTWRALWVALAEEQAGVREDKGRPNRGERVDEYIRTAGLDPTRGAYPWCQAFVYWCLRQAAQRLNVECPAPRTASVASHWARAPRLARVGDLQQVQPGCVFVLSYPGGRGHTGLVVGVDHRDGVIVTVEGNTDASGTREGDGVYQRRRPLTAPTGYLDYSRVPLVALPAGP